MPARRTLLAVFVLFGASLAHAGAQDAPQPPKSLNQNVRIDVTIALKGDAKPVAKTLSMVTADGRLSKGRAGIEIPVPRDAVVVPQASAPVATGFNYRSVGVNVDATPTIIDATHVLLRLKFEFSTVYKAETGAAGPPSFGAGSNEITGVVFESGKPVIVTQSADGETGREYAVTITTTILK